MSKTSEAAAESETLAGDVPESPLATDEPESDNVDTGGAIETIEIVMPDGLMERETLKKIEYHYIQGEGLYIEVTGENQSLVNALMQELKIDLTVTVGQSVIFMEEK